MKGLKKHSHEDREKVIREMIPLIKKKFGDNLIALAAQASYARNEDTSYSDLELIAFVREMPEDKKVGGMGKIRDGMLVELLWMTKENYLEETLDVTENWYIAGSDTLLPIINKPFIESIKGYEVENLRDKCLKQAAGRWYEVQESAAKVLNAIEMENKLGISVLVFDMYLHMLITLSFLNQTPYTTFSKFIAEAGKLPIKPQQFDELTHIMVGGKYQELIPLKNVVESVFTDFENILEDMGFEFYYDNFDPNKPMKKFV
jgi:hypothetical protein